VVSNNMSERLTLIQAALRERIAESGFGCGSCGESLRADSKVHIVVASPPLNGAGNFEVFFKCGDCIQTDGNFVVKDKGGEL
jgi:hypothetical protein